MFKSPVKVYFVLILLAIVAGASQCKEIIIGPNFGAVPKISYRRYDVKRNIIEPKLGNRVDELILVIHFEDGDGDLGLTSDDRENNPRFKLRNPDGTFNDYYYNYFATAERRINGQFVEINQGVPFTGAFPPLKPDGKPGPIEGELEYSLFFPLVDTPPNDTLRFSIQIVDRALNLSNQVTTELVVINQR